MIPSDITHKLLEFTGALAVLSGAMAAWWRKDSPAEDAMTAAAADTVLDAIADADTVARIDLHTGRNLRDQINIGQAQELEREATLRRFPRRN
jgi:hypothetical protein